MGGLILERVADELNAVRFHHDLVREVAIRPHLAQPTA